jgi:uncharacterized protein (TIGR02270 family)
MLTVIESVVAEHLLEAQLLWLRRAAAVHAPNYSRRQFADLDQRLEAHLDGLRVSGANGSTLAAAALDGEAPGPEYFFPASVLALEAMDDRFARIVARAAAVPGAAPGIVSALGWVSPNVLGGQVKSLLSSQSAFDQALGLAACAVHRREPGPALEHGVSCNAAEVRARAVRAAGELGRRDLLPLLLEAMGDEHPVVRFWASRSSTLLGNRGRGLDVLAAFALDAGPYRGQSLKLALQALDMEDGHGLLRRLPDAPESERLRVVGAGIIGGARYVPWLIERMTVAPLARVAAEAFVNITGTDFNLEQLETSSPPGFEEGPTDDPSDENVAVPEDAGLPWPDVARVRAWWERHRASFTATERYFMGAPVTREHCIEVLMNGYQRQRILAAHYLCLLEPGTPLFNTSAPAWRQQRLLADMK